MNETTAPHPSPEQLADFLQGRLPPEVRAQVESHVAGCAACCEVLRTVPEDTLLNGLKRENTLSLRGPAVPPRPLPGLSPELARHPRYEVLKLLGRGGMGVVYLARHRLMDRLVALKVIHRELVNHARAVERFRQEVQAAARLMHPNIVTAHDAEQAGDLHLLVMEFVRGTSLERLVREGGPLPVEEACTCAVQAAQGLQFAHEQGMVHRDVKPSNLMRTDEGTIKLLDFGLARLARERLAPRRRITELGTAFGSPDYVAPEQATDAYHADTRADVYGLGCTLYFLLAGRPPFAGGTITQKLAAHVRRKPPALTRLRPEVPPELARVVARMMAKSPADRYQTPGEAARALAPFTKPASGLARVRRAKTRPLTRRYWLLAAAVLALAAGAVLLLTLKPRSENSPGSWEGGGRLRVLYVLARQNNSHEAYAAVREAFQRPDVEFLTAAPIRGPVTMRPFGIEAGPPVTPDRLLHEVMAAELDAVIFGDGIGMAEDYRSSPPTPLIEALLAAGKPVVAIGKGVPAVLLPAGVLAGRRATGSDEQATRFFLDRAGAQWSDEAVVVDRHVITARGAAAASQVRQALFQDLGRGH